MQVKLIDGAVVIEPSDKGAALTPADFSDKPLTIVTEPAFYVALDKDGLLARSVSVTAQDRKVVAALVGNWIAEGFQPLPADIKLYSKYVRDLAKAHKPAPKADGGDAPAAPTPEGGAPADGGGEAI